MRFPRPNRFRRVSVRSLPGELGVSEPATSSLSHREREAVFVGQWIVFRGPIVEPENLFAYIAVKMERLDSNVCALQSTLEARPEVLNTVCVNMSAYVFLNVIYGLMYEVALSKAAVSAIHIGIDGGLLFDSLQNLVLQSLALHIGNNSCPNLARATVKHSHNYGLAGAANGSSSDSRANRSLAAVHVLYPSADKGFVYFYRAAFAAHLAERLILHGLTDAVKHEPCRLLGNADGAVQFVAADAVPAIADHPYCRHPLIQTNRRVLKDSADLDGELLLAAVAEPHATGFDEGVASRLAARADNLPIGPAEELRVLESTLRVREVSYCLLEGYGLFHLSHHQSRTRLARFVLCVKYIIAPSGKWPYPVKPCSKECHALEYLLRRVVKPARLSPFRARRASSAVESAA